MAEAKETLTVEEQEDLNQDFGVRAVVSPVSSTEEGGEAKAIPFVPDSTPRPDLNPDDLRWGCLVGMYFL